jgi:uncharacterized protein
VQGRSTFSGYCLIEHSIKDGRIVFSIKVLPRASRSEIVGEQNGLLRVKVSAPPVDGAANEELVRLFAKQFNVPRRAISIVGGESKRLKRVSIQGLTVEQLQLVTQSKH